MNLFDYIVHRVPGFFERDWRRNPVLIDGPEEAFRRLFGWDQLSEILGAFPGPHPMVRAPGFHGYGELGPEGIIDQARSGNTLVLENSDFWDRNLATLCDEFSLRIGDETRCNLYVSSPGKAGFPLHADTHENWIIQIEGTKDWVVCGSTDPSPLFVSKVHELDPPSEDTAVLRCRLRPGQILYLPRGAWHRAMAEEGESLHITLSVFPRTPIDFANWLADELTEIEAFREALPPTVSGSPSALVEAEHLDPLADRIGQIREQLHKYLADTKGVASEYAASCVARQKNRRPFNFPAHLGRVRIQSSDVLIRPSQRVLLRERGDETIHLVVRGKEEFTMPASAMPAVRRIFSEATVHVGELLELGFSLEQIQDLLAPLVSRGLLKVAAHE